MALDSELPRYPMTLLVGAGASKPFDIPTTKDMAQGFLKSGISESMREKLEDCKDIEDIISYLSKTRNEKLGRKAYSYIRDKCREYHREKAIQTYEPILRLSKLIRLNIYTTNYDTVIEDACDGLEFKYDDGFVRSKDIPKFDHRSYFKSEIRIFKMHGSITWYRKEPDHTIFKFPYELEHTEDIKKLMIYPTKDKDIFTYPFYLFQFYFSNILNSIEELISIGHSFNDVHILAAVKATLATRNDFRLLIVNPNAADIKERCFTNEFNEQIAIVEKNFEEWSASMYAEYKLKAEEFVQKSKEYEMMKTNKIISEYRQSDHFKKQVEDICKRLNEKPIATSPHSYDLVVARSPMSPLSLAEITQQRTLTDMIRSQPGLTDFSTALLERPCSNCNKSFKRNPIGVTTCPHCTFPNT